MSYLDELNPAQRQAVTHRGSPLLVLAGAGSGKTRVITYRILSLIEGGAAPSEILAVTFTNKAAKEMRERVEHLLRARPDTARLLEGGGPTVTTFHSFGVSLLRDQHTHLGLKRYFTIFDRSDSISAIKQALEASGYGEKQFEPRRILSLISKAKGAGLTRLQYADGAASYIEGVVAEVWERYDGILARGQALDFDDLLLKTMLLLREFPAVRTHYQDRFRHIHIDEYQDTNSVQYEIARLLAGDRMDICAVGDVDQNIYSWRGADLRNILQFERHFTGATTILLEENYRSTQTIIAASNQIIEKNTARVPKTVFTKNAEGERVSLYAAYNESDEAQYIAGKARELIRSGAAPESIAVLFRANFQSRALEDAFLTHNVPYQMLGTRFFERKEIKDMLSFLRLVQNPDSTADLSRIINVPARGIGKVTLLKVIEGKRDTLTPALRTKVDAFFAFIESIRAKLHEKSLHEAIKFILAESGLEEELRNGGETGLERLENIRELVSLATRYDSLPGEAAAQKLLEDAALQSDQDELDEKEKGSGVKLMTVHAAKGLEFAYVFVTGLEEGLFPHERLSNERVDDEEERRLFYVALTRAQKKVFLSFAGIRTVFGSQRMNEPSSFLADIDESLMESANPQESGFERTVYLD